MFSKNRLLSAVMHGKERKQSLPNDSCGLCGYGFTYQKNTPPHRTVLMRRFLLYTVETFQKLCYHIESHSKYY